MILFNEKYVGFAEEVDFMGLLSANPANTLRAIVQENSSTSVKAITLGTMALENADSYLKPFSVSFPSIFASPTAIDNGTSLDVTLNSQLQNTIFAAPSGSNGQPSFRKIVQSDLTGANVMFTSHAANSITSTDITHWDASYSLMHSHSNKSLLDSITLSMINDWNSAIGHTHTTSQITALTGYTLGTNVAIAAADTLNTALGKIQAQINGKENTFSKNTAFNKNFGTAAGTVAEGNDSRILNGQTAFSWGNHAGLYATITGSNINQSSFRTALGLGSNAYTSTVIPTNTNQLINDAGFITDAAIANKVDKVSGKSLIADAEIARLATLDNYTHPANHPPSIITQDASNRFVTDVEKTAWNAKQGALGFTPENVANKSDSYSVSSTVTYPSTKALVDGLGTKLSGTLTTNRIPKSFGTKSIGDSSLNDNGSEVSTNLPIRANSFVKTTGSTNLLLASGIDITQESLPISTATQTAMNLKANLASPSLTGTPRAPTAELGTNTTQIATTAFVAGGLATKENAFSKNTAFNKNFGTTVGTIAEGNDSRILNGQTAFGWGNHAGLYPTYNGTGATGTWGINISGNSSSSQTLYTADIRSIAPVNGPSSKLTYGFTTWDNNNLSPYADYLHLRSYRDISGGNDNLVTFNKSTIGMRIWQQTFGSATAYSNYKDVAFTDGSNSSGIWNIGITGTAQGLGSYVWNPTITNNADFIFGRNSANEIAIISQLGVRNFLGLGSNAYDSTAYLPLSGGTLNGNILFSDSGTTKRGIQGRNAGSDFWFVGGGATTNESGYLEIATGDDGQIAGNSEPIYVSQYGPGDPLTGTLFRRAKLLDENGNTSFPGSVSTAGLIRGNSRIIATGGSGSSYNTADLEVFSGRAGGPVISLHWPGMVASTIGLETSGRIAIRNNPGTGYEDLIARYMFAESFNGSLNGNATSSVSAGNLVGGINLSNADPSTIKINDTRYWVNAPNAPGSYFQALTLGNGSDYTQIGVDSSQNLSFRFNGGIWNRAVTTSTISSYALLLSGGVLSGDLTISGNSKGLIFDNPTALSSGITHQTSGVNIWSINKGAGNGSEDYNIYNFSRGSIDISISNSNGTLSGKAANFSSEVTSNSLKILANGITTTMGALNSSWCHMSTNSAYGWYFYHNINIGGGTELTSSSVTSATFNGYLNGNASSSWSLNLNVGASLDSVTSGGLYREEFPSSAYNYTTTLNMNSVDGRQQLTIARDGAGMKFRGNNSGSGSTGWGAWKDVIHSGNIASQSVNYANSAGSASSAGRLTGPAATNGSDGWFRSDGQAGWYSQTYAVGIYATEGGKVRTYNGASFSASAFYQESDMRLKTLVNKSYSDVRDIQAISYLWKDPNKSKEVQVGYSAQQVKEYMPSAVTEDSEGVLSVNYIQVLIAKIESMEKRIKELEDGI